MTTTAGLAGGVTNTANQPDLLGNLAPVADELGPTECAVTGRVPEGLRGTFVRNGPNPLFEPIGRYNFLDGDGMLHGITFRDRSVTYRNRWIRSKGLSAEIAVGHGIYPGLGDVMNFPPKGLTGDAGPVKNPANTHIIGHAGRMLALWEGGLPTEVTPDLDTIGEYDFAGHLKGSMTAHPRLDPRTGEMFCFAYSMIAPYLRYFVIDAAGALVHSVGIDLPAPVMMHDFVITQKYAVFLDSPIVFDMESMMCGGPMVKWLPENGARIGVMPRMGTAEDLTWHEIDPGHVQHFWNGHDDGDRVVFTGSRLDAPDFGIGSDGPLEESTADPTPGRPSRFWVDLATGTAGWDRFDDLGGDFTRINDAYTGVRSRFMYMSAFVSSDRSIGDFDTVVKYDDDTGARTEWFAGEHAHVGESVFAPDPEGSAEDDGWLLNAVYHDDLDATDVVVLDARDVGAGPIASARMPRRIPFGFHANWFADDRARAGHS